MGSKTDTKYIPGRVESDDQLLRILFSLEEQCLLAPRPDGTLAAIGEPNALAVTIAAWGEERRKFMHGEITGGEYKEWKARAHVEDDSYEQRTAVLDRACPECGAALEMTYSRHGFKVSCPCGWGYDALDLDPLKLSSLEAAHDLIKDIVADEQGV